MKLLSIINSLSVAAILSIFLVECATYRTAMESMVRTHENYPEMTADERTVLSHILDEIANNPNRAYYIDKLFDLLNSPYVAKKEFAEKQKNILSKAVKSEQKSRAAQKKTSKINVLLEELLQDAIKSGWEKIYPDEEGPHILVHRADPTQISVRVSVFLEGDTKSVKHIRYLEDAVEKHLHMSGFNLNLVFVSNYVAERDFKVKVNHNAWASTHNWTGNKHTLAHELMHLLGLPDEYDIIEMHCDNENMSWLWRLQMFYGAIDQIRPEDSADGIMAYMSNKPLQRHICSIVGLGEECVELRYERYGM